MGLKTAGTGFFQIPTAPAALTAVAQSASANTLGSAVSFGNAPSTMFITGVTIGAATTQTPTYVQIQVLVAGSIVGSVLVPYGVSSAAANSVLTGYRQIYPPIPVASGAAITVKSASSVASAVNWGVSLECIAQSNVVDDGIAVGTVTTVTNQLTAAQIATGVWQDATAGDFTTASSIGKALYIANVAPGAAGGHMISGSNAGTTTFGALTVTGAATLNVTGNLSGSVGSVTGLTASNLDAAVSSRMASYTQPTGFLAATFPATVASTTNITAGTITTVTNLTNAATAGDFTAAMKTSIGTAVAASAVASVTAAVTVGTNNDKTGYTLVAGPLDAAGTRSALGLATANLDTQLGTLMTSAAYTAPDNAGISVAAAAATSAASSSAAAASDTSAIKAKTDGLTFTLAGKLDVNLLVVNGVTLQGDGTAGSPWGPV